MPLLLCLCGVPVSQGADADTADLYSRLVFDVCIPEAIRSAPPPDGKMEFAGFVVRGPGVAGDMAKLMQVSAEEKIYMVATADAALARKVQAYLAESRKSCVVMAQSDVPDVQDRVLAQVNGPDHAWVLYMKSDLVTIHNAQVQGANIELMNRKSKPGMTALTLVRKSDLPARPRVTDAAIAQWVTHMIDACSSAGTARRAVTDDEVADYFERTASKTGAPNLTGKSGFPSGMLFTDASKGKPCQFAGSGGYEETQQLLAALRSELATRGATPTNKPRNVHTAVKVQLPKPADARRSTPGIIVTYGDLLDGSVALVSFWVD